MRECPICGASGAREKYVGLRECPHCGHVFSALSIGDGELAGLYGENYFFGEEYSDYVADKTTIQKNFLLRLEVLDRFIDPHRHMNLVEIGCAYGFFLEIAARRFASAVGFDIGKAGTTYARETLGVDAVCADFKNYDLKEFMFDVACMWDTIEHLADPAAYARKISAHMEKGGLLAITTGDISSINAKLRGKRWRLIHPPTHLHYFKPSSVRMMLHMNDFDLIHLSHCGFYRSIGMTLHNVFTVRAGLPWVANAMKKAGMAWWDFYLNLFDIMYVIGRKR